MDQQDKEKLLPPIDGALVEALDKLFPEKLPEMDSPVRELYYRIGQRSVVKFLREHHKSQMDDDVGYWPVEE